jgi:diguanylate cyclase (GGDEF)-like protein
MSSQANKPDAPGPSSDVVEERSLYPEKMLTCVEIGKALTSTFSMDQILLIILKRLSGLIKASNWTLFLLDQVTQQLRFELVVGLDKGSLSDVSIKLGEGIAGTAALTGEPILVPDVRSDPRFSNRLDDLTGFVTRSLICLPLKMQGSVIGIVEVVNPEDQSLFEPSAMPVLSILADYVAIAIHNARTYEKIESLSVTDDVTGFFNTRYMHKHLDRLLQQAQHLSLVFLDLDNFKQVVDTHGHPAGSKVLAEVATVIASQLAATDRLVRYGGDEFLLILPSTDKREALDQMVAVRKALAAAVFLQDQGLQIKVTASMGIASFPDDAGDKKELLQRADQALYRSKKLGRDSITLA